jgi:hypothetical protein
LQEITDKQTNKQKNTAKQTRGVSVSTDHGPSHTYHGLPVNWCRKLPPPRVEVERNSMGVVALHECVEIQVHVVVRHSYNQSGVGKKKNNYLRPA